MASSSSSSSHSHSPKTAKKPENLATFTKERASKRAKREYKILSSASLQTELEQLAGECSSILYQTPAYCKLLLRHVKWQKMVLLERFFDEPDRFLTQAGLMSSVTANGKPASSTHKKTCGICWESATHLRGLSCDHRFCTDCWTSYLIQKVLSDGIAYMSCPERGCDLAVVEDFALELLREQKNAAETFTRLRLNSFVDGNPLIKWCPAQNCDLAVKVDNAGPSQIKCDCGHIYCFQCSQPWHAPISCSLLRTWLKQCSDDSETYNWINAYTKDCPKCKTAIEKNGGCNHMTCRKSECKHEFCWVCMDDWKKHQGNYSCNRFNADKTGEKKVEESRTALKRYLHYYDRFRNHENSLKLEHKLYEQVIELIGRFKTSNFRHVDTLFLSSAVDTLCASRRTLMYTYSFAFYLEQNNTQTTIFEDNQRDLEVATEQLSEFMEREMDGEQNMDELKRKVQDKTTYVEHRQRMLLKHCVEGTDRREWRYNRKDIKPEDGTVREQLLNGELNVVEE